MGKKYNTIAVEQYDVKGNFIRRWNSITEAAEALGIRVSGIVLCCQGRYKTSGKFVWCYAAVEENEICEKEENE